MKQKSITKKSALRLALLGLVLFLGVSITAGALFYRQNLKIYQNMAYSYVELAALNIDGDKIEKIVERGDELSSIEDRLSAAYSAEDMEEVSKIDQELDKDTELSELYKYWNNINWLIFSGSIASSDIRYFYVLIPEEDHLSYLWDSDIENGKATRILEPAEYGKGEKENLMKAFRGEWGHKLAIYHEKNEILGTAMTPICNENGEICAIAALDVSITDIRWNFLRLLLNIAIVITIIMTVSVVTYFAFLRREVIDPIIELNDATGKLVKNLQEGNENTFKVNIHTGDELEVLAHSFEEMDERLRNYIKENAAITAEKERIGTELSLATRIQADMLPNIFPPFPEHREFSIYASMDPAKEVGGDFYDFFLVDEDHLGLVIADVSGKGIPAALFMMMSKIMIQNYALSGRSPQQILEIVNNQICMNNKEQMFVTVWIGILELSSGRITAANAGHEYPVLKKQGGRFELYKDRHGFVVGGMEDMRYHEYTLQMDPGSVLFVYTDGLAEASNISDELFGTERMIDTLNETADEDPKEILDHVHLCVDRFVGNASQFDDLTMLCIVYHGPDSVPENKN